MITHQTRIKKVCYSSDITKWRGNFNISTASITTDAICGRIN